MSHTLNNNLKVFLKTTKGVELKTWLNKNGHELKNHRIFYILKANLEKGNVFKIGLSERGTNSAYGRLNDYYNTLGASNNSNPCMGVKLYLVVGNIFNPSVQTSDTKVRQMETKMIRHLGTSERGRERFAISIQSLFKALDDLNMLKGDENAPASKRSDRILSKNQASQDTVKGIVSHEKDRRGNLTYNVEFFDALVYDKNEKATTKKQSNKKMTYQQLVTFREGKRLTDIYNKDKNI